MPFSTKKDWIKNVDAHWDSNALAKVAAGLLGKFGPADPAALVERVRQAIYRLSTEWRPDDPSPAIEHCVRAACRLQRALEQLLASGPNEPLRFALSLVGDHIRDSGDGLLICASEEDLVLLLSARAAWIVETHQLLHFGRGDLERHARRILRRCREPGELAKDAVSLAIDAAHKNVAVFGCPHGRTPMASLYYYATVGAYTLLRERKRHGEDLELPDVDSVLGGEWPSAEDSVYLNQLATLLERADPRSRRFLTLYHLEGWSKAEIAEDAKVSTTTVKRVLGHNLDHIRKKWSPS